MTNQSWLLPEGIEELLPAEAASFEALRRNILDLYRTWGYQQVNTPLVEFLDSLLTGSAKKLDLETFKLTDQLSGRLMGVRADITPQLARIDARDVSATANTPSRLCYVGSVLRTRADELGCSRNPTQIGVELYGHDGIASDIEVLTLMCETINTAKVKDLNIDLGHVGIYRGLAVAANLNTDEESSLFEMMQRKAQTEINSFVDALNTSADIQRMLKVLPSLSGDLSTLEKARAEFKKAPKDVLQAIDQIEKVAQGLLQRVDNVSLHIDLAELRGYGYKTGIVFAAFLNGHGREVARGGRYDGVGERFGRARAATGFSVDLKTLVKLGAYSAPDKQSILAPAAADDSLHQAIQACRAKGYVITEALDAEDYAAQVPYFQKVLVKNNDEWQIKTTS